MKQSSLRKGYLMQSYESESTKSHCFFQWNLFIVFEYQSGWNPQYDMLLGEDSCTKNPPSIQRWTMLHCVYTTLAHSRNEKQVWPSKMIGIENDFAGSPHLKPKTRWSQPFFFGDWTYPFFILSRIFIQKNRRRFFDETHGHPSGPPLQCHHPQARNSWFFGGIFLGIMSWW